MESKVFIAHYLIPEYHAISHNIFVCTGTFVVSHEFAYGDNNAIEKFKKNIKSNSQGSPCPVFNGKISNRVEFC